MDRHRKRRSERKQTQRREQSWREFERLVTRVEEALAPMGAKVASPDKLMDRITGEFREVDASIRYKVGTTEILIILECRERKTVQDSMWIEQLATKQRDVGAAKCIAATTTGFTKGAERKAAALGIELRRIRSIDSEAIENWTPQRTFFYRYEFGGFDFGYFKQGEDSDRHFNDRDDEISDELVKKHGLSGPAIISKSSGKATSIRQQIEETINLFYLEVPEEKRRGCVKLNEWLILSFSGEVTHHVICSKGLFDLTTICFRIKFSEFHDYRFSRMSVFDYADPKQTLVRGLEFELTSATGPKKRITIHNDLLATKSSFRVWHD
jgi:hypothetical protein